MTPRKAALRVAHARACTNATASSPSSLKGCPCQPSYYVFQRDRNGRPIKSQRVKTRKTADAMLRNVLYLYVSRLSAETGLRLRELVALDWQNVSLTERTLLVAEQWQEKYGKLMPKGGRIRTIYLTRQAARTLEQWAKIHGATDGPVFTNPKTAGLLSAQVVEDRFENAREAADVPKLHSTMRDVVSRKSFQGRFTRCASVARC